MRKLVLYSFLLLKLSFANAQNYCAYLPYSYNSKYGLVSNKQEKIIEPKYTKLEIMGEFAFALFDDVHCYNLSSGKYTKTPSSVDNSFVVIENELFIFNSKSNTLINPFTNQKIPLKLSYQFFYNRTFFDYNSKKTYDLIFAYTTDNKQLFFKPNKTLPPAIVGKFNFNNFDLFRCKIDGFDRNIGIMIYNHDKSISCYNYDCSKSFKIEPTEFEESNEYYIQFKESVHKKFVSFYGFESDFFPNSFSISKIGAGSDGRYFDRFIETIQIGNGYSLVTENNNYKLNSTSNFKFKEVKFDTIYYFNNSENVYYLKFTKPSTNEEIQIFVNHPKINPNIIMLPDEYLKSFELIK